MKELDLSMDPDIRRAHTLPSAFYTREDVFAAVRECVFVPSWQLLGDGDAVRVPGSAVPLTLLEGLLDEPLLLARDGDDQLHLMSNVCTHRGNLVVEHGGRFKHLRCPYHGRRFALDGSFHSMPECAEAIDFPSPADDLSTVEFEHWQGFLFASLAPAVTFEEVIGDMRRRLDWLPFGDLVYEPSRSRDYLVRANWALYCDNYLEGFHIPFVHDSLNDALDYGNYRTELYPWSSLQLGIADDEGGDEVFTPPVTSPDHGLPVAAYYWWLFPNTMVNVYPWGVSMNIVKPLAIDRTRVSFMAWVWDASKLDQGAGAGLDRVEREDEAVVESVQRGMRSRLYRRGRYSPTREQGVHHFHRLLATVLAAS